MFFEISKYINLSCQNQFSCLKSLSIYPLISCSLQRQGILKSHIDMYSTQKQKTCRSVASFGWGTSRLAILQLSGYHTIFVALVTIPYAIPYSRLRPATRKRVVFRQSVGRTKQSVRTKGRLTCFVDAPFCWFTVGTWSIS